MSRPKFTTPLILTLLLTFTTTGWPLSRAGRAQQTPAAPPRQSAPAPSAEQTQQDDDEVVRVETDLASVLLTAVDKDKQFVKTLRAEDVRLFENDVPQRISTFQRETDLPLSLAILIDTSKSQERTLPDEKRAANAFISKVLRPAQDRAAIVSFTGLPRREQALTNDVQSLGAAIERVKVEVPPDDPECERETGIEEDARCWTAIWDSIYAVVNEDLSRTPEQTRRAIILLADGDDTAGNMRVEEAIDFALKHNVAVYAIGIGDPERYEIKKGPLNKVATRTGGRAYFPRNDAELDAAFAQIQDELRSQYLVAYSPTNKARDGSFRRIRLEVANPELRKRKINLLYRQGYYAKKR